MRIALSGQAYTGKSTLAKSLVTYHNFRLVDYTSYIKAALIKALHAATNVTLTSAYVDAHKKDYRTFLQGFAEVGGFNAGGGVVGALHEACGNEPPWPNNMVFDNVRTQNQMDILEEYGFVLVTLDVPESERWKRAKELGVSEREYQEMSAHQTEKNIPIGALRLDGHETPFTLATLLATLAQKSYSSDPD